MIWALCDFHADPRILAVGSLSSIRIGRLEFQSRHRPPNLSKHTENWQMLKMGPM